MSREPGRLQQLAAMALTLMAMWMMLPEHQRRLLVMRATVAVQRVAGRAARREGHAGMGSELAGRTGDAARSYLTAFHLSRARDRATRILEGMRP
jgi:hypothetical protein